MSEPKPGFYEFFAGGGMARTGLGDGWECLMANEWSEKKAHAYRMNFEDGSDLVVADIRSLTVSDLPSRATLAWASFPCQDLSLAGNGKGLQGERSGTFWSFLRLMNDLSASGRGTPIIVLENVYGTIKSNQGRDFKAILEGLASAGYCFGPMVIDAVHFVPQSRPRLFIVAVSKSLSIPIKLTSDSPLSTWHPKALIDGFEALPKHLQANWIWWNLPMPTSLTYDLSTVIEDEPKGVKWHSEAETKRLLGLMSEANLRKVKEVQERGVRTVGTIYKRTRVENGEKFQRAEVRFDQISGCLRTPTGGSSRQLILVVEGESIRSRLLSPREAARLMGLSDAYRLPERYNDAYYLLGDGLAVPVVTWLERHLLRKLAQSLLAVVRA